MPDTKQGYFAENIIGPRAEPSRDSPAEDSESSLTSRVVGQEAMLELRFKDGRAAAGAYPCLTWAEYDPQSGITLEFPPRKVRIHGSKLKHLFTQIKSHKRTIVEELSSPASALDSDEKRPHVTRIQVEALEEERTP